MVYMKADDNMDAQDCKHPETSWEVINMFAISFSLSFPLALFNISSLSKINKKGGLWENFNQQLSLNMILLSMSTQKF